MDTTERGARTSLLRALGAFKSLYPAITVNEVVAFLVVCDNEGLSVRDLARRSGLSEPTASRSIRSFGRAGTDWARGPALGLVEAFCSPHDQRVRILQLTAAGAAFRDRLQAARATASSAWM